MSYFTREPKLKELVVIVLPLDQIQGAQVSAFPVLLLHDFQQCYMYERAL